METVIMKKEPRRSLITVAVTVDEKTLIESRATASNMTISSYVRLVLIDAQPITLEVRKHTTTGR